MSGIDIFNPNVEFELTLCKPNRVEMAILSVSKVTSVVKTIDDIDSVTFEITNIIKDRFTRKNRINPLYDEIHEERLICLNDNEYFVIKDIDEEKGAMSKKIVSAVSLEQKLNRIDIQLEDIEIVLLKEDKEDKQIAILDLLYFETGWKVGHVDDLVRFDIVDGEKKKKVRWQESVSSSWYSLLTETIADIFSCIVQFDTENKVINLYSLDEYGENLGIYLSYDNYLKSIKRQSSTEDIVTRLRLSGKDEMDIREVNPHGRDYVEDYSYFVENNDMSDELVNALANHNELVEKNQIRWEELTKSKQIYTTDLTKKNREHFDICEEIKVLISMKNVYEQENDTENANRIQVEIDEKTLRKNELEQQIKNLEYNISNINIEITNINIQMDRIYATYDDGTLIFPECLLSELNEFLYYDSYSNTSYLTANDLMNGGKRELSRRCIPTTEFTIDSVNFISKILNHKNVSFKGSLNMGDVVILYDDYNDKEILLYFVGYELSPSDRSLNVTLSNKKTKINNTKSIADYLKKAKRSNQYVESKSYIFNQLKYNRI
ncbi:MAG: phage tail protein [Clostridium sp.]|uniref:phage tail protein n=1 Tax=Clostridium sp. TaxID=1506 RepID=UPI003EE447FF